MHNDELCHVLFPDWDFNKAMKFMEDKEEMFRRYICLNFYVLAWTYVSLLSWFEVLMNKVHNIHRLASVQLEPMCGLEKLCKWIEERGLKRAAVTNAPRPNAELIISMLGLSSFFELLIIGSECERAKPFPDPYLKALQELGVSPEHAFVFEVCDLNRFYFELLRDSIFALFDIYIYICLFSSKKGFEIWNKSRGSSWDASTRFSYKESRRITERSRSNFCYQRF